VKWPAAVALPLSGRPAWRGARGAGAVASLAGAASLVIVAVPLALWPAWTRLVDAGAALWLGTELVLMASFLLSGRRLRLGWLAAAYGTSWGASQWARGIPGDAEGAVAVARVAASLLAVLCGLAWAFRHRLHPAAPAALATGAAAAHLVGAALLVRAGRHAGARGDLVDPPAILLMAGPLAVALAAVAWLLHGWRPAMAAALARIALATWGLGKVLLHGPHLWDPLEATWEGLPPRLEHGLRRLDAWGEWSVACLLVAGIATLVAASLARRPGRVPLASPVPWLLGVPATVALSTWFGLAGWISLSDPAFAGAVVGAVWQAGWPRADLVFAFGSATVSAAALLASWALGGQLRRGSWSRTVAFASFPAHLLVYSLSHRELPETWRDLALRPGQGEPWLYLFDWGFAGLAAASLVPPLAHALLARPVPPGAQDGAPPPG
jgi:hypothetical protein